MTIQRHSSGLLKSDTIEVNMKVRDGEALLDCGWTMRIKEGHYYFYDEEGVFVAKGQTIAEAIVSVEISMKLRFMACSQSVVENALPEGGIEA